MIYFLALMLVSVISIVGWTIIGYLYIEAKRSHYRK